MKKKNNEIRKFKDLWKIARNTEISPNWSSNERQIDSINEKQIYFLNSPCTKQRFSNCLQEKKQRQKRNLISSSNTPTSYMMTHRWWSRQKAHSDLNYVWTSNNTHQPPLYQIRKTRRVRIVRAEVESWLINFELVLTCL